MKLILKDTITDISIDFVPTSIFLNGIQTYDYTLKDTTVFFNQSIDAGTELTFVPAEAVRLDFNGLAPKPATATLNITEVGKRSIFSEPFGEIEFSADQAVWYKSLTMLFPATVYARHTPIRTFDFQCVADTEIIVWQGGDNARVTETGLIEVTETIPTGAISGGLEYHVY